MYNLLLNLMKMVEKKGDDVVVGGRVETGIETSEDVEMMICMLKPGSGCSW